MPLLQLEKVDVYEWHHYDMDYNQANKLCHTGYCDKIKVLVKLKNGKYEGHEFTPPPTNIRLKLFLESEVAREVSALEDKQKPTEL